MALLHFTITLPPILNYTSTIILIMVEVTMLKHCKNFVWLLRYKILQEHKCQQSKRDPL